MIRHIVFVVLVSILFCLTGCHYPWFSHMQVKPETTESKWESETRTEPTRKRTKRYRLEIRPPRPHQPPLVEPSCAAPLPLPQLQPLPLPTKRPEYACQVPISIPVPIPKKVEPERKKYRIVIRSRRKEK